METDFAIVGFGPTGATMANLLAARGHRVAVIDRETAIYDKPRAITADHEALRAFQACGLAERIAADTVPHPGTDYLGLRGQVIKRFYPLAAVQPLAWEPTFMFVQPELEARLREGLARYDGVSTLLGYQLVDFEQDADGVTLSLVRDSGGAGGEADSTRLRARYLLGCDGGRSQVRKQLGSTIEDLAFDEWWIVVDAHLLGDVALPERCVQYCRPSRPGTYIVGPGRLRRWEIKMLPGETPDAFQTDESVRRVLSEFVDESALTIVRTAIYRFHALVVAEWRDGRVFLMGDAAHQMPPFLGQGLCAGVRDAVNLAWKLDMVERHRAPAALLDTYAEERKPHVRTVVAHAKSFGLIIGELDPRAARERDARLEDELASGRAETIRQHFIPDLRDGLIDVDPQRRPRGLAGRLFVQPWIVRAGRPARRLDDLVGFDLLIAATSARVFDDVPAESWRAWRRLGGRAVVIGGPARAAEPPPAWLPEDDGIDAYVERDGLFADWMAAAGARAVIVRPDRYVYGSAGGAGELRDLLGALLERCGNETLARGEPCNEETP